MSRLCQNCVIAIDNHRSATAKHPPVGPQVSRSCYTMCVDSLASSPRPTELKILSSQEGPSSNLGSGTTSPTCSFTRRVARVAKRRPAQCVRGKCARASADRSRLSRGEGSPASRTPVLPERRWIAFQRLRPGEHPTPIAPLFRLRESSRARRSESTARPSLNPLSRLLPTLQGIHGREDDAGEVGAIPEDQARKRHDLAPGIRAQRVD